MKHRLYVESFNTTVGKVHIELRIFENGKCEYKINNSDFKSTTVDKVIYVIIDEIEKTSTFIKKIEYLDWIIPRVNYPVCKENRCENCNYFQTDFETFDQTESNCGLCTRFNQQVLASMKDCDDFDDSYVDYYE